MNKLTLVSIALLVSGSAFANLGDTSGSITLSGTVPVSTTITVTAQSGYNSLNIADGETDKLIAVVNEKCNKIDGYTVELQSLNAGSGTQASLKETGNADTVNYSIKYDSSAVSLVGGKATVTNASGRTGSSGVNKNLTVTIPAVWANTGTYTDTLTLTIAAK